MPTRCARTGRRAAQRPRGPVRAIAFSPNGRHLASGSADGTIRLWDPVTASPTGRALTNHTGPVRCLALSPDGQLVASTGDDATVRFWSPATGRPLGKPLTDHHGPVTGLSFAPKAGLLTTTAKDKTLRLWPHPAIRRCITYGAHPDPKAAHVTERRIGSQQSRSFAAVENPKPPRRRTPAPPPQRAGRPPEARRRTPKTSPRPARTARTACCASPTTTPPPSKSRPARTTALLAFPRTAPDKGTAQNSAQPDYGQYRQQR
ncbi:hypothetical protein [Streptomyces sp. NPDC000983]|uniref:WD40 repeat domain-containing protein n=1 Tax=Streptomyces sp. NPDC000983 TaxID=3154373 RepID=UPI00331CCB05